MLCHLCGVRSARRDRSAATWHLILTLLVALAVLTPAWGGHREGKLVENANELAERAQSAPATASLNKKMPGRRGGCPPRLPQIRTCPIKASGSSSRGFAYAAAHRMDGNRRRQRVDPQQPEKGRPREEALPSPTAQPLPPEAQHRVSEPLQQQAVAGDSVVRTVTNCSLLSDMLASP